MYSQTLFLIPNQNSPFAFPKPSAYSTQFFVWKSERLPSYLRWKTCEKSRLCNSIKAKQTSGFCYAHPAKGICNIIILLEDLISLLYIKYGNITSVIIMLDCYFYVNKTCCFNQISKTCKKINIVQNYFSLNFSMFFVA